MSKIQLFQVTTIIKELSLVYQNITVTYETSRTMSGQQQIIVLVCVNGTGTNEDQFAALLKNHTTATAVDGANVTSMDGEGLFIILFET